LGDVVDMRERAGLFARSEYLERPLALQALRDQVWNRVRDSRLARLGPLAGAIRVERTADRVTQPELVMGGAGVDLARKLREAVGGARRQTLLKVGFGR